MSDPADRCVFGDIHEWQPGPYLPGSRGGPHGEGAYHDSLLLVCRCGAIRRVRVPYTYEASK